MVRTSAEGSHVYLSAGMASGKRTNSLSWIMTSAITSDRYPVTPGVPSRYGYTWAAVLTALIVITSKQMGEKIRNMRASVAALIDLPNLRNYTYCAQLRFRIAINRHCSC